MSLSDGDGADQVARSDTGEENSQGGHSSVNVYLLAAVAALGGLLWGYDTGVIAGAQGFLKQTFHFGTTTQEIVVSSVAGGAVVGAIFGGRIGDWLGRKRGLIFLGITFTLGSILTAIAPSLWTFVVFRLIVGFCVGGASVMSPMYITELAPPSLRGRMGFLFQFMITVGILLSYTIGFWFVNVGFGWRSMFAVAVIPSAALAIGMLFLPEEPRWLASKGRWDEAEDVLRRIVSSDAEQEMKRIRERLEEVRESSVRELFTGGLRWALIAGVGLSILQQLVGINAIVYYAPIVAGYSGIATSSVAGSLLGAILVGAVFVLGEILSIYLADRAGRRTLLFASTAGMLVTMGATGALFLFDTKQVGIFILLAILLYVIFFAIGMGPVFWLMSSEIFPTRLRGAGASMSATGNWSTSLVVTLTFLTLIDTIGKPFTFWIYGTFSIVAMVFVWFLVPETNGKPLEDIEEYWEKGRSWERVES
ncbi:MAG: sugar porter family MFS transporter [Gemmatimonadaceae bacterium]